MKLAALLCWYDEPTDWLAGCVTSLPKAVEHLVALDGAYFLYPDALRYPCSPPDQAAVIVESARAAGLGLTLHTPAGPWMENEVEKRSFSFELGRSTGADWFLVIDADEFVSHAPFDLHSALDEVDEDFAFVSLVERGEYGSCSPSPRLFRNTPGLRLEGAHYRYVSHKAAVGMGVQDDEPGAFLLDLRMEHRPRDQHSIRRRNQRAYYELRDELGVERKYRPVAA